ncbi:MAG: AAA family ATPase [Patescibacteria group bacterium]|nr:AAA family ATPase [Patescibacteria group bacterium]
MFEAKNDILYSNIVLSNSPWIRDPLRLPKCQEYRREAYFSVEKELHAKHGMAVLIKGPRRVGKTEIQKQLINDLVRVRHVTPKNILYLTFDDAQILSEKPENHVKIVQAILDAWAKMLDFENYDSVTEPSYCFFDEVQAVEGWAHLIKNRVERNSHIRVVLSGSAAHSIFEKALKILMGRVMPVKLTTFSFREYMEKNVALPSRTASDARKIQSDFEGDLNPRRLHDGLLQIAENLDGLQFRRYITDFLDNGGFPQLWQLEKEGVERALFIDENYVRKVTLEDLLLLQKINKPELYERLLRHLFARPGHEYNQNKVASYLGTTTVTLSGAMRLLEQTELLIFAEKFSAKAEPLKLRNVKIYPIDMMLTFAMTKISPSLEAQTDKGVVAESLVAQTIARLRGLNSLGFMQSKSRDGASLGEIDFYLRSDNHDCPLEVKYQQTIRAEDVALLREIIAKKGLSGGLLITPESWRVEGGIHNIPLWAFMLLA